MTQNDEAERLARQEISRLAQEAGVSVEEYHAQAARNLSAIRTQAARIAELEAANRGLVRLNEATQARAEAAKAEVAEMTRRRDEWRKKAEGYDAVRLALREKVGTPWPPNMSRLLWAGIAADEKKRADDAEAEVARLREALTLIERLYYIEDKDAAWRATRMNGVAREAQDGNDLGHYRRIFPRAALHKQENV